jgi:N-acetylneuraminic acid mutarotase
MKKNSTSKSAFFNIRVLTASVLCLFGVFVALLALGAFSNLFAQPKSPKQTRTTGRQDAPGTQKPEVTQMVGPAVVNADLRDLPVFPSGPKIERPLLKPGLHGKGTRTESEETSAFPHLQSLLGKIFQPVPNMPPPLLTFDGISSAESFCGCIPPDTIGDVGPNNYVATTNSAIKIFDKSGNTLLASVSFDTFFAPLGAGTPCGTGLNQGDPYSFYDHLADRWVVSDFAFASFGGNPSYECVGVSQTSDPVAGGWFLYAVLVDSNDANDYPKAAMWNNPQPGGAYHFTYNMWADLSTFTGVKVQALDRGAMLAGQQNPTVVSFKVPLAGLTPDIAYSFVAAGFRTGDPPPAGRDEMLLAIRSGTLPGPGTFSDVLGWLFHVDFVTPANSTLGIGTDHSANASIAVNAFTEAWIGSFSFSIVPQQGTSSLLDTLGDKIMTPVVYQNRNGTESLWADQTTMLNWPNGPTAVSWYQFDVTGGAFPAAAAQQQEWSNGNDGLWRFMPSLAVDQNGNMAIGYATSSSSIHPGIRYAGRLEADPPNNLTQGEAVMFDGVGSQNANRWGDYSMTTIDPSDGMTFWHANEYYSSGWKTRIGKFNFQGGGGSPTPTPTATPSSCSWGAGADLPQPGIRFGGVFFPANGKFYAMGGRDLQTGGTEFTHPFEYDPVANSWTTKAATYPDPFVSNTECAVANDSGTDYIYCVGGSQSSSATETSRVFRYDPVADVITTVAANWPPGDASILPGGITVFNNTIYILGGFDVLNNVSTQQIWAFTPNPAGWVQKNAIVPVPLAYIPTTTIGSLIYTAGGVDFATATDMTNSYVYDPVADSISPIADIPRPSSDVRGLTFCNKMYVVGGGGFPTYFNEVDIYDPASNTWSIGAPFNTPRRNAAVDTDGTNNIWVAGGLDENLNSLADTQIFNCPVSPCGSPSPTPTPTATATPIITPTPRPTPTPRGQPTPRPRPTPPPRP